MATALHSRNRWLGARLIETPSQSQKGKTEATEEEIRLLDYACGTGAITKALGPFVHTVIGIDVAEKMVEAYNNAAAATTSTDTRGATKQRMHAVVGDLCGPTVTSNLLPSAPDAHEYTNFDIAVVGLGFHHFESPSRSLSRLGERLRPHTGVLVIVDFLPFTKHLNRPDGQRVDFPEMQHTIKHAGFTIQQMRDLFEDAGFVDFDMAVLEDEPAVMELKTGTVERTLFVAKGRRAW